ncbi:NADAR family protein [Micromonospora sp. MP36]|nr:NADAR family protein [Micromonospora sp. MP36]
MSVPSGTLSIVSPRSVADLVAAVRSGRRVKFLHFWGHRPQRDGSVGAGCLSQWWPAPFTVDGRTYATAEHWMMWQKATLFGDAEVAERVLASGHPQRAKALGRQVRGFDEATWAARRYEIVVAGSVAKFGQHEELGRFLLGTGERVLVEASPVDRIWGIGLAADDPRAADPARWRGENLLGFALMDVRAALREARP